MRLAQHLEPLPGLDDGVLLAPADSGAADMTPSPPSAPGKPTLARTPRTAWQLDEGRESASERGLPSFSVPATGSGGPEAAGSPANRRRPADLDFGGRFQELPGIRLDPAVEPAPSAGDDEAPEPAMPGFDAADRDADETAPVGGPDEDEGEDFLQDLPARKDGACLRRYNERDICDENEFCQKAFDLIHGNPLSSISLDISPKFKPDAATEEEDEAAMNKALAQDAFRRWRTVEYKTLGVLNGQALGLDGESWATRRADGATELIARFKRKTGDAYLVQTKGGTELKLPVDRLSLDDRYFVEGRPWRNHRGEQIAFGRFVDFENGDIYIEENGNVRKFFVYNMGRDELGYLAAYWGVPTECTLSDEPYQLRDFTMITFAWKASGLCHKPLYFEHIQLERYGHSYGPLLQPIFSGAHFFVTPFVLPYKMGINPPNECQYALGYYRPGSCAPYLIPPIPLSARGALYEAAAVTGTVFILP